MKKLESGRSMVEMLGVLAIIGVLSVGGIAGYTLSMRRHRANGVADAIAKFSLVAYSACQNEMMADPTLYAASCDSSDMNFDDAGLGDKPSGVTAMKVTNFNYADAATSTGTISVETETTFNDKNLCAATASIFGKTCTEGTGTAQKLTVSIKQD